MDCAHLRRLTGNSASASTMEGTISPGVTRRRLESITNAQEGVPLTFNASAGPTASSKTETQKPFLDLEEDQEDDEKDEDDEHTLGLRIDVSKDLDRQSLFSKPPCKLPILKNHNYDTWSSLHEHFLNGEV